MLNTSSFLKFLISFIFTLILIANILYAFNINSVIGGTLSGLDVNADLSNSYFGVSTFLDNWENVYANNSLLSGLGISLQKISELMQKVNFVDIIQRNYAIGGAVGDVIAVVTSILNTLFNIAWIALSFFYVILFLLYITFVIFSFFSFILTFISGFAYTPLPSTEFPDIQPLPLDLHLIFNSARILIFN